MARLIAGKAVGVCFGGGGARGNVHFGVIKAMQELGIPIDVVSGTSFGALAAAMSPGRINEEKHSAVIKEPVEQDWKIRARTVGCKTIKHSLAGMNVCFRYAISAPEPSSLQRVVTRVMTTQPLCPLRKLKRRIPSRRG